MANLKKLDKYDAARYKNAETKDAELMKKIEGFKSDWSQLFYDTKRISQKIKQVKNYSLYNDEKNNIFIGREVIIILPNVKAEMLSDDKIMANLRMYFGKGYDFEIQKYRQHWALTVYLDTGDKLESGKDFDLSKVEITFNKEITKEEALKTLETKDAKYKLEYISDLVDIQEIRVAVPLMENPEMIIKTSSLSDEAKDKIMSLDDKRYIRIRKESGSVYISVPIFGIGFNYKLQDGFNPYEYEDSRKDK